ncbi:D-alanyl-D-alanine carboxypeptidase/D-alanyl-D-alanine endopeptidase [Georgenia muralis]
MARSRIAAALAGVLVLGGYTAADAADVVPGVLTTDPVPADPRPFPDIPGAGLRAPAVAGPDTEAPVPGAAALEGMADSLRADHRMLGEASVVVADGVTGEVLLDSEGATPRRPASSLKVLTAAAALTALGPDRVLTTSVVQTGDDRVVLVAGGDVMLAAGQGDPAAVRGHAGLADLAAATAAELTAQGVGEVSVSLADGLFTGPVHASGWSGLDLDFVMPVQALAVDSGRDAAGGYLDDPALEAARTFAAALADAGVAVPGTVRRTPLPDDDLEPIASVDSAPLAAVVREALRASDNSVTEVLGRLVAIERGGPADFAGATTAVREELADLGLDVEGVALADTSGLSMDTTVPARLLTDVLVASLDPARPELAALVPGLPVGNLDGTLAERFTGDLAGRVRAKTGTLTVASSLSGTVLTADGRLLVFSVLTDDLPVGTTFQARLAIDDLVRTLGACGC